MKKILKLKQLKLEGGYEAEVESLHEKAMDILEEVITNRNPLIRKSPQALQEANMKAYSIACHIPGIIPISYKNEPNRSMIHMDVGYMAYGAGNYPKALELAQNGLEGAIHPYLIEELTELKDLAVKALVDTL